MPSKETFATHWTPQIGEDAVRRALPVFRAGAIAGLLVPTWSLLLLFSSGTTSSVIGHLLQAVNIVMFVSLVVRNRQLNLAMSKRFGIKVWILNSPTLRDGFFEAWCKRHNVDPTIDRSATDSESTPHG